MPVPSYMHTPLIHTYKQLRHTKGACMTAVVASSGTPGLVQHTGLADGWGGASGALSELARALALPLQAGAGTLQLKPNILTSLQQPVGQEERQGPPLLEGPRGTSALHSRHSPKPSHHTIQPPTPNPTSIAWHHFSHRHRCRHWNERTTPPHPPNNQPCSSLTQAPLPSL